jgi:hypothetical protein
MQWQGKHASITIKELLGSCVFCWGRPEAIFLAFQAAEMELRKSLAMAVEDD